MNYYISKQFSLYEQNFECTYSICRNRNIDNATRCDKNDWKTFKKAYVFIKFVFAEATKT